MNKISLYILLGVFLFTACKDENKAPILTFDQSTKGAYVKLVQESDRILNLSDISNAVYCMDVEFVDLEQGALVAEYNLDVTFDDNTPDNGDQSAGPVRLRSIPASSFADGPSGFKALDDVCISLTELLSAFGYGEDQLALGDVFEIDGEVVLQDGSSYRASNSSAAVNGSAFQGHFAFDLNATCPTNLAGDYAYETVDAACPGSSGGTATGTVTLESNGGVNYIFSDWAFGAYGPCYGGGTAGGALQFKEECSVVCFNGFTDSFGDTWTFDSSIEGDRWTIAWSNTYNESATSTVIFPGGVPFTLCEQ